MASASAAGSDAVRLTAGFSIPHASFGRPLVKTPSFVPARLAGVVKSAQDVRVLAGCTKGFHPPRLLPAFSTQARPPLPASAVRVVKMERTSCAPIKARPPADIAPFPPLGAKSLITTVTELAVTQVPQPAAAPQGPPASSAGLPCVSATDALPIPSTQESKLSGALPANRRKVELVNPPT